MQIFRFMARQVIMTVVIASGIGAQTSTSGILTGRITIDNTGVPTSEATVSVVGTTVFSRTDSAGRFFLRPVPLGQQVVRVQQIGFMEKRQTVSVSAGEVVLVDFHMTRPVTKLDTQRVKADNWMHKPARLANTTKYDDFYTRKTLGAGGMQLTHEELEQKVNARLEEIFSSMAGVHLTRSGSAYAISLPSCPQTRMAVFVNGHKEYPIGSAKGPVFTTPGKFYGGAPGDAMDVLSQFDLNNVEAIEVYKSITGMPAEAMGDTCAALYIWTR